MPLSPERPPTPGGDAADPARIGEGSSSGATPLSVDQRTALDAANARARDILKAARMATFTAWSLAVFGGLSLLFGLAGGASGVVVGAALIAVAWNEFRGRELLRRLDLRGPRVLGWNQLVLLAVVAVYCLWAVWSARTRPSESVRRLEEVAGLPQDYVADLTATLYAVVLVAVALVQWLLARYHFRRRERVAAHLAETPGWIVELQREGRLGG